MAAEHSDDVDSSEAAARLAQLQEEVERLQRRIAEDRFAQDLRDALQTASAAAAIGAPVSYSRLLNMIVATAAATPHILAVTGAAAYSHVA